MPEYAPLYNLQKTETSGFGRAEFQSPLETLENAAPTRPFTWKVVLTPCYKDHKSGAWTGGIEYFQVEAISSKETALQRLESSACSQELAPKSSVQKDI